MNQLIYPIILCGGSGTRLWPLSRKQFPKQFVPLFSGKSLLTLTCERLKVLLAGEASQSPSLQLITGADHRFLAREAAHAAGLDPVLLLEPEGRNTAAAMAAAALLHLQRKGQPESGKAAHEAQQMPRGEQVASGHNDLLLFLPADNYIPDAQEFARCVHDGINWARAGHWVIAGVRPSYPATGYGYIQAKELSDGKTSEVLRFVEKPQLQHALDMLAQGDFFWNAGMFLVRAQVLLESLRTLRPELLAQVEQSVDQGHYPSDKSTDFVLGEAFKQVEAISIDYAVLEHQEDLRMVRIEGVWSDVGSWTSVAQLTTEADANDNRIDGHGIAAAGTKHCYIRAPHRPVVALGLDNLLIVDTADAVLIAHQNASEHVKQAVQALETQGFSQAKAHRRVARPWGSYDSIDAGDRFLVKRITVNPGAALSLQLHHHRAEHWIVVRGTARVTRGNDSYLISENESTFIPLGVKHRLENPGLVPLEMIEVQSGSFLSEEDIVRFSDQYGRAP
ncbi:MAG: mannose-1-phosphate guanylyltransferase/mannose-6-phosphate isomerase [Betaproteobacteria bacterium]|nr:mannose-1-phosphate guanylyltransferase/mannose-6-phosphate isomerase [Betaproteobacteria bacterium]